MSALANLCKADLGIEPTKFVRPIKSRGSGESERNIGSLLEEEALDEDVASTVDAVKELSANMSGLSATIEARDEFERSSLPSLSSALEFSSALESKNSMSIAESIVASGVSLEKDCETSVSESGGAVQKTTSLTSLHFPEVTSQILKACHFHRCN